MVRLLPFLSLLAVAGASVQAAPQAPAPSPSPPTSAVSSASAAVPPPAASSGSMSGSAASATGSMTGTATSCSAAATSTATGSSSSNLPGYSGPISNLTAGSTISFGNHWAALHLDMINGIVASVQDTDEGKAFLDAAGRWLDATHGSGSSNSSNSSTSMTMSAPMPAATEMQAGSGSMTGSPLLSVNDTSIQPLNILTRIYFSNAARPELHPDSAFAAIAPPATESTAAGQLVDAIQSRVSPQDIVFAKTRYYAGAGNALEEILRAQSINIVVLSGIRTSGVILATASHLIDLDYIVYVLSDAVIETPSADPFPSNDTSATAINDALLKGVLPKLGVQVITVDDAIKAMQPASASGHVPAPAPAPAPSSAGTAAPTTYSGSASATATGDAAGASGGSSASAPAPAAGMPSPATAPYSPVRPSASSSALAA